MCEVQSLSASVNHVSNLASASGAQSEKGGTAGERWESAVVLLSYRLHDQATKAVADKDGHCPLVATWS